MTKELPAEISRLKRELEDFEAKIGQSSEDESVDMHPCKHSQPVNVFRREKPREVKERDHNCQFPVHRCYCGQDETEVRKTQLRKGRQSLPNHTGQKIKPALQKRGSSEERENKVRQVRKHQLLQTASASVQKSDIGPTKKNRSKEVYDVDSARVTVQVTRDRGHSPPTKETRRKPKCVSPNSEAGDKFEGKKRWAEILKEQNRECPNVKKTLTSRGTQYEEKVISEASMIVHELKQKTSYEGNELKSLLGSLEKILKKLDKKIPKAQKEGSSDSDINRHIEKTYQSLEASCKQLEESCLRLKRERDSLREELSHKNTDLQKALLREIEFKNKLTEANASAEMMAKKIEKYSESTRELTSKFAELQEGTKDLGRLQKKVSDISSELQIVSEDRDGLKTDLELVRLERDKLKVLLSLKDGELVRLKKEVMMIGDNVTQQAKGDFPREEDTSQLNLTAVSKTSHFFCSSPNTTSSEESPITKSWKRLSAIGGGERPEAKIKPKEAEPKEISHVFTKVISLKQTSPERLNSLKSELKELFAEMKHQAELAIEHEDATSTSEILKLTHASSWTQLSDTSHAHSLSLSDSS